MKKVEKQKNNDSKHKQNTIIKNVTYLWLQLSLNLVSFRKIREKYKGVFRTPVQVLGGTFLQSNIGSSVIIFKTVLVNIFINIQIKIHLNNNGI